MQVNEWSFVVQASRPCTEAGNGKRAEDLPNALARYVLEDTESAIIRWNFTAIPASYKYDVSVFLDDWIPLAQNLLNDSAGTYSFRLGSQALDAEWELKWHGELVHCAARWITVAGDLQDHLNARHTIIVERLDFAPELLEIVRMAEHITRQSNCFLVDDTLLREADDILDRFPRRGKLYRACTSLVDKHPPA